jgi:predicted dehydrogenase
VRDNFEAWAVAAEGGASYIFTPEQLLANMEIFEAIVRSAESGKVIEIA